MKSGEPRPLRAGAASGEGASATEPGRTEPSGEALRRLAGELGVELTNARAAREFNWLLHSVGTTGVCDAMATLHSGRRVFPLNIARALGLRLPASLAITPHAEAQANLAALRARLQAAKRGGG